MRVTVTLCTVLLVLVAPLSAADKSEALTPEQRRDMDSKIAGLLLKGLQQFQLGQFAEAQIPFREAVQSCRILYPKKDYPQGSSALALATTGLGRAYQQSGEYGRAEPLLKESVDIYRALYPKEKYPQGQREFALSINNLATLHYATGEYGKAEPLFQEALDMLRALYPRKGFPTGERELAIFIGNLGNLHQKAKEYGRAEPLLRESLDMLREVYPKQDHPHGHRELAIAINSLGFLYKDTEDYGKAERLLREGLDMRRALFPKEKFANGHPELSSSINNLAFLYKDTGEYGQAQTLLRESLEMTRALYPKEQFPNGHRLLADALNNRAFVYQVAGEYGKAGQFFREAVDMNRRLLLNYAELAAEAEYLNYLATQTTPRHGLLSATRHPEGAAPLYDALWDTRAALTRLQERRHRDLMASRDKDTADLADQLRRARSDLARRLLNPLRDLDQQRATVEKLTDAKEDLEKRIAARLKLAPQTAATSHTSKQLAQALPAGAVFVDLYRYTDLEQDPNVKGKKGEKRTPRYVAFVLLPGQEAIRVELQEAAPIERAWAAWQKTIVADRLDDKAEREAAARFAERVWQPIRAVLPANTKTIYLVPDGPLHQVPWGALPNSKPNTILLDESAICLVPHGPFLLDHLQAKPVVRAGDTVLAYGGIDYAGQAAAVLKREDVRGPLLSEKKRLKWGDLPGTAKEQEQVVALARKVLKGDPISRSGHNANTRQLEDDLPKARYAHLATHGFFADPEFRSALQIDPQQFERMSRDRRGGARSPLVLSGLVLAGANRQGDDAAPDRGIITAEGLIGLRLEGLELAVLSACETGLGEDGGGEGVYGLQRAFHIAGCRNVIASLWKVDDGATQALMTLFYRNLWEKKMDAAEALRQAQLTLYRHPEAVEVAKKRGVDFTESDLPKVEEKPTEKPKRSPTAHWAAFTFSGVRPVK